MNTTTTNNYNKLIITIISILFKEPEAGPRTLKAPDANLGKGLSLYYTIIY